MLSQMVSSVQAARDASSGISPLVTRFRKSLRETRRRSCLTFLITLRLAMVVPSLMLT